MRSWLHITLVGAVALAASDCDDGPTVDCDSTASLYEKRIAPLFAEDRPKSCNQCHLSGIDLELFASGEPCDAMACMVERGLVSLEDPAASLILSWIDRAAPDSKGITSAVLREEREGFLEWIELTSACGTCSTKEQPCGEEPVGWRDCELEKKSTEEVMATDPGDCAERTLEALFLESFFPYRGRCYPCHVEGKPVEAPAPKWIEVGACETASLATLRNIARAGYIDVDAPEKSPWLLKPLDEEIGGLEHGGGTKFHSTDEEAFRLMSYFATRYAQCQD